MIIVYGPRQAGKTTLVKSILEIIKLKKLEFIGDDLNVQKLLSLHSLDHLKQIVGAAEIVFIDEAQRIENIGLTLKLIIDQLKIRIIVTGSSSLDLSQKINEPLTGRSEIYYLYPISIYEQERNPLLPKAQALETLLRFGMYPKVLGLPDENGKQTYLENLINNYLYKDILVFSNIRNPKKVVDLLKLLALQIGSQVSISELATQLSINKLTVEKYLDLLEKMFVIYRLGGFSRNLRKEISKSSKYYFLDTGLRNALLNNFNALENRDDTGKLFENFKIIESLKEAIYLGKTANFYFWRTYDQKEIDLVVERNGVISGFEFKYNPNKKYKIPGEFKTAYKASVRTISAESFEEKVLD